MARFVIDRCCCTGQSFVELLDCARREQLDWSMLASATQAGRLCKHCRPWLQRALSTGLCSFSEDSEMLRNGEVLLQHFAASQEE